jgi:hypothetical protein
LRHANHLIYDDFIPEGIDGNGDDVVHTGTQHNSQLGRFSQLAIQVICTNPSGDGNLKIALQESCDGKTWINRKGFGNAIIETVGMDETPPITEGWADACQGADLEHGPLFGFVRLRMWFTNDTTSAHVKVYVTQRGHHH